MDTYNGLSGRRTVALSLVLLVHLCLISVLELNGNSFPHTTREAFITTLIMSSSLGTATIEAPSLALDTPAVPFITPPVIEIASHAENSKSGSESPITGAVLPPRPDPQLSNPEPEIRAQFRASVGGGHSVIVIVRALVLESGAIGAVVLESSCGVSALDQSALEQVKQRWHFLPATSGGKTVRDWISVEVMFKS